MQTIKTVKTKIKLPVLVAVILIIAGAGCSKDNSDNGIVIVTANGDITAKLNEFRQVLGATLNTQPGAVGGRREINWDAVPDSLLNQPLPNNFFNPAGADANLAARQRGLTYETVGQFMVSNNKFTAVNSQAASEFSSFSGVNAFANVSSNLWQIDPEVPGEATAATIHGMGIVFSDVDVDNSTFMEFFSEARSLGKFFVPKHDNSTKHSFLGVYFKNEKVTHVRVGHDGKLADGEKDISGGGTHDLIIMDDFLYDEPVKK